MFQQKSHYNEGVNLAGMAEPGLFWSHDFPGGTFSDIQGFCQIKIVPNSLLRFKSIRSMLQFGILSFSKRYNTNSYFYSPGSFITAFAF